MSFKHLLIVIAIGVFGVSACVPEGRGEPPGAMAASPLPKSTEIKATSTPTLPPTQTVEPSPTLTPILDTSTPEPSPTSPPPTSPIPADWLIYNNRNHGFELSYPPGGTLVDNQPEHARIDLPFMSDTTLQEKYLEIDVTPIQADSTCSSPFAAGYAPEAVQRETVNIGGKSFVRENGSEGAAGSTYEWVAFSTVRGQECTILTFILNATNAANYEVPPPEFDSQAETAIFEQIVSSFQWME